MSEKHIHSYSSPYNVGHKALGSYHGRAGIFEGEVYIQEKVDGSQFSFRLEDDGKLYFRSRNQDVYLDGAGLFAKGVEAVTSVKDLLTPGYTYRGEYLAKPKHNCLPYDHVPKLNVVIFDIEASLYDFLDPIAAMEESVRIGFDYAPVFYTGLITGVEQLKGFLDNTSILGGPIEGIVIKPVGYLLWSQDKKVLMGKYVREAFKEKHDKAWKDANPGRKEIVQALIDTYRTPQRWEKAVQHLTEAGVLEGAPQDIGKLFVEVPIDILKEHSEEIKEALFKHFWKDISRGVTAGLAPWYKNKLVEGEFSEPSGYELPEGHPNRETDNESEETEE